MSKLIIFDFDDLSIEDQTEIQDLISGITRDFIVETDLGTK